ncbi:MAG: hypothetical protein COA47_03825 [Robiginitomaculum sp.]|nr:MAG: hypothetical protein COA47_03825 [Robiginitomaculum sp.]
MHKFILATLFYCGLSFTPAFATEVEQPENRCLRVYSITGFTYIDEYHALLAGRTKKENYLVRFRRTCRDLNFASQITTSFEHQLVCRPVIEHIRTEHDRCPVDGIQMVSGREEARSIAATRAAKRQQTNKTESDS